MAQGNLGVLFNNLRGKAGSVVFARGKDGTVIKPRVTGRNPRTAAQLAVRAALGKAAANYKNMTPAQVALWEKYAQSITRHDPETSKTYTPSAITVFTALAAKFYQMTPNGTAPLTPPTAAFNGDTITLTATGDAGAVMFTASAANAANVRTELLLQPLKSRNRKPQPKGYRTKAFFAFTTTANEFEVAVPAGWYVPAVRFVNALTGQDSELVVLAPVQVS